MRLAATLGSLGDTHDADTDPKEAVMKVRTIVSVCLLGVSLSPLAYADALRDYPQAQPLRIDQTSGYGAVPDTTTMSSGDILRKNIAQGKTRAEVRAELIEAQRAGIVPTPEADYPPSKRTIERNQARFSALEKHVE
jgi:hypothetical protein